MRDVPESLIDDVELANLPPKLRAYAAASALCDQKLFSLLQASARMHELTRTRLACLEQGLARRRRSWLAWLFG